MIRHGEKEAEVTVETSEGDVITWGRKENSSFLIINGERHTRLSNHQEYFLQELHKVLRLPQVKNKDEFFDIHFASQKEPIFLLNDPPSRAATFFSVSSDAGRLVEVRDLFKTKINKAKEKKNSIDRKINQINEELEKLTPLNELEKEVKDLKLEYDALVKENENVKSGFQLFQIFNKAFLENERLSRRHSFLELLQEPPQLDDMSLLESTIQEMKILQKKEKRLERNLAILNELQEPFDLELTERLEKAIDYLIGGSKLEKEKILAHEIALGLRAPPKMEDEGELTSQLKVLKGTEESVKKLQGKVEKAFKALEKWVKENPTCPTCGGVLSEEHLLDHE
jgi:exonuclease SbcC